MRICLRADSIIVYRGLQVSNPALNIRDTNKSSLVIHEKRERRSFNNVGNVKS